MPINEPSITATCDTCGEQSEPMEMCALAGGGWDERDIKRSLKRQRWRVEGESTTCENCVENEDESKA